MRPWPCRLERRRRAKQQGFFIPPRDDLEPDR
jgi:hypothetical protein